MKQKIYIMVILLCFVLIVQAYAQYNPSAVPASFKSNIVDLTISDKSRGREIPVRIYLPGDIKKAPVILFSHGLGGSKEGSAFLGEQWSSRGYTAVFIQHPGSDESVWKGKRPLQIMAALKKAANIENFLLRVKDVSVVIDQLGVWNKTSNNVLMDRLDMDNIGMAGHSFGAITTQAVSGQAAGAANFNYTDKRIKAALILSPSSPAKGSPKEAFKNVKIPWMLMTGSKDVSPIGDIDVESRLSVFPALPAGDKYELVLYNAEHSVFTDRPLPGEKEQRNPNHHKAINAISTAFWDAYLKNDANAKTWINGQGPASVLEPRDRWQKK
jgi:predicted dienelactone hydrolase